MRLLLLRGFVMIGLLLFSVITLATVQEYVLDNGLKVLVREDHRAPVVVSQVWYKVGSSYEHEGGTGVSHVLEHMMFKGTEKYAPGEFSRIIAEHGGQENAFTGKDYTAYFQTLASSQLAVSLELEADRMHDLKLMKDEFAKEVEVVKEERRWRTEDQPQSFTYEVAMSTAFQTGAYRNPIVGWMNDLNEMTVADLQHWYRQWYVPNNAVLVVSGDVRAEEVFQLAKRYFGPLPASMVVPPPNRPEVLQNGMKRITVNRPAELPYLLMAYKTPVLKTVVDKQDAYALEVLAGILDGGNSARLSSNLVRGKEIAVNVGVSYNLIARLDSVLLISGTPAKEHSVDQLEAAINMEIESLQNELVGEDELMRIKAQVVSNDVYERDSVFYQAMVIGLFETAGLSWQDAEQYVASVNAVNAEQIQAVARKYLQKDQLTVTVLNPQLISDKIIQSSAAM